MELILRISETVLLTSVPVLIVCAYAFALYLVNGVLDEGWSFRRNWERIPRGFLRFSFISLCCLVGALAAHRVTWHVRERRIPAGLAIHIDSLPWKSVTVESFSPQKQLHRFESSSPDIFVAPIHYGEYRFSIDFADGRKVWAGYIHTDAGRRRRVDIYVTPSARAGYLHFLQTENFPYSRTAIPRDRELFSGDARPEETSAEKPFGLGGV